MGSERFAATDEQLRTLAADLGSMVRYLEKRVRHLNELVESVDAGWKSAASTAYKQLQKSVNQDAARITKSLVLIEEAVRLSRGGFTAQELDLLHRFQRAQKAIARGGEFSAASRADAGTRAVAAPDSKLDQY
ncbi:WXG100 family type VII secretion target [Streptomyces albireticuli]|uniref:WXG100 family type VII secretion target n=1 Tax=Streptomyces albireticuli TaxID=1940 RepID=UPI0036C9155A